MAYKGILAIGTTVDIQLQLAHAASGPAHLIVAYGRSGGSPSAATDVAAPGGGTEVLSTLLDSHGTLTVTVDMSDDADSGTLTVNATPTPIVGDTVWLYSVS